MKLTRFYKQALAVAAVIALYGLVGGMDYKDQQEYQAYACEMVKDGLWPKEQCKE